MKECNYNAAAKKFCLCSEFPVTLGSFGDISSSFLCLLWNHSPPILPHETAELGANKELLLVLIRGV